MYKEDLALNNLQGLIYHKTKPNQILYIKYITYKKDLALNNLQMVDCIEHLFSFSRSFVFILRSVGSSKIK